MLSARESLERIAPCLSPVDERSDVDVWGSTGYVLADSAVAPADYPPVPRAGYDGYAVNSSETPGKFRLAGSAPIGAPTPSVGPREAIYVTTGAYLPGSLDAVIPQEDARILREGGLEILAVDERIDRWNYVDPPGYHAKRGDVMLREGSLITHLDVVALASIGVDRVAVRRHLRVFSLSVGSELSADRESPPSRLLMDGRIPESNSLLLRWYLSTRAPFADLVGEGVIPDDSDAISSAARRALEVADVLVTFGGSGPSAVDLTGGLLASADCSVDEVRMKPGRPSKLAALNGRLIAMMPGHPLAALHAVTRLLDPLIYRMAGARHAAWPRVHAVLAEGLMDRKPGFSQQYLIRLEEGDGRLLAFPVYKRGTGVTSKLAGVSGLLNLDEDQNPSPGDHVDVLAVLPAAG